MAMTSTRMGVQRRFSNQAPAVASGSNIPTIQYSTGNAQALAQFSRTLFGLSSQFEDQLDQTAEAEASKEGAIAGAAGDTTEMSYETIRGRAHNKAMLETFVTTLDTRAMVGANRIRQQYYNDPVKMETALNDFFGGISDEVDKVAPGAGASFRARQTARALPAVEEARDTRYKLTREEADANLIEHEAAVMGSVTKNAAGLFSSNPAQSKAASVALQQTVVEYMRTYDAVDEVTGKPLYTPAEKAKATVYLRDKVMTGAALSWFDQQPDKASAWLQMQDPDFKFQVNVPPEAGVDTVVNKIIGVESGGRADARNPNSSAAGLGQFIDSTWIATLSKYRPDVTAGKTRKQIIALKTDPALGREMTQRYTEENAQFLRNAGVQQTAGNIYLAHFLGPRGAVQVAKADPSTPIEQIVGEDAVRANSFLRGKTAGDVSAWSAKKMGSGGAVDQSFSMPLRKAMSESAYNKLDTEMRERISFANTQAERDRVANERQVKAEQDAAETEVSLRIFSAGTKLPDGTEVKPIDALEIASMAANGVIDNTKAQAFIKAINTERPDKSDPLLYQDLQRRMYNGEDIQEDILAAGPKLSNADSARFLNLNKDMNIDGDGKFTNEEQFNYTQLKELLQPQGIMTKLDPAVQNRTFEALTEYRRRVQERGQTGEKISDIVRDIKERAFIDLDTMTSTKMDSLVLPRYAVKQEGGAPRSVDVSATKKALVAARKANKITQSELEEQANLLRQWDTVQQQFATNAERAKAKK